MSTLSLNNIVNTNTEFVASSILSDNLNITAIITTETPAVAENYGLYTNSRSVEVQYGSASETLALVSASLSQTYNQITGGGAFLIISLESGEAIKEAIKRAVDNAYPYFYGILTNKNDLTEANLIEIGTYLNLIKDKQFIYQVSDEAEIVPATGFVKSLKNLYNRLHFVFSKDADVLRVARISAITYSFNDAETNPVKKMSHNRLIGDSGDQSLIQSLYDNAILSGAIVYGYYGNSLALTREGDFGTNILPQYYADYIAKKNQISLVNLLANSKVLQFTTEGLLTIENTLFAQGQIYVDLGIIASGKFYSETFLGKNKDYFIRTIEATGFFVYVKPLNEYIQTEKELGQVAIQSAYILGGEIKFITNNITIQK